jgi:hypothetical protein
MPLKDRLFILIVDGVTEINIILFQYTVNCYEDMLYYQIIFY